MVVFITPRREINYLKNVITCLHNLFFKPILKELPIDVANQSCYVSTLKRDLEIQVHALSLQLFT